MIELKRSEKDILLECVDVYIQLLKEKVSDTVCYNEECRELFNNKLQDISVLRDKIFEV